jgi:hypothetical protein
VTGDAARRRLVASLDALLEPGLGYEFILLRETPLDERCVDCGDVDLLGTPRSVRAFLARLSEVCGERGQSFQVRRTKMEKTQVSLLSADLRHRIVFDLWSELWQVFRGRRCLRFRDLHHLCQREGTCLLRLPPDVEWAIYGQHLAFKRKDLSSAGVQQRLHFYAAALEENGHHDLAEGARGIARTKLLGKAELTLLESTLSRALPTRYFAKAPSQRWSHSLRSGVARRVRDRRLRGVIALVGVDGVGKTTIGAALASAGAADESRQHVVGKSLFRESRVFRELYARNRRLPKARRLRRERIDDVLAPLAFLVAAIRVRRSLRLGGVVLVDRYLPDFLYVKRKTDRARFSLLAGLLKPLCPPVQVVHLSVPHSVLQGRKTEITAAGMRRYEESMRAFYATRRWVDYLRFNNRAPADAAIVTLESYLFATRPQARSRSGHGAEVGGDPRLGPLERVLGAPVMLEDLKHKPGRRRTARASGAAGTAIVKQYGSDRAATVAARVAALAAGPPDPVMPRLLMVDPGLRMVLLSEVPGVPLRVSLLAGDGELCRRAGSALGEWHRYWSARRPAPLRDHTVEHELAILDRRAEDAAAPLARAVRSAARGLAAPWACSTVIHRDLYEEQLLVGSRIGLIDVDDAALGPPELDVGNLLAHVELLSLRSGIGLSAPAGELLAGYAAAGPPLDELLLERCRRLSLLRLACIHAQPELLAPTASTSG